MAENKTITIDATDKALGRLASEIAIVLRGKDQANFAANKIGEKLVMVKNIDKMKITGKKLRQKIYYRHLGMPGHMKKATMQEIINKKGKAEVLRRAVKGMLPINKLRPLAMKNLKITN